MYCLSPYTFVSDPFFEKESGIQRQVMFSFLRDAKKTAGTLTHDALQEKHQDLDDLVSVLADLTKNGWLIRLGEASHVRYKINFRRRRASKLKSNMWASLTDRLIEESNSEHDQSRDQSDDQPTLPSLSDW